jgi:hypothetical protein
MTTTYRNGAETIEMKGGKIVSASNSYFVSGPYFQIGSRISARQLGDFGYRLVKKPVAYDVWGRKIG